MKECFTNLIGKASFVAVVAHEHPDADSLGSASAIYTYLLQLHKKCVFVSKTKDIEKKFHIIPWVEKIKPEIPKGVDLVIVCDCASKERVGFSLENVTSINIDHHATNTLYAACNIVEDSAISTTRVVYDLLRSVEAKINQKISTALYAGLIEDSDAFMDANVDGTTFAFAKELIELGAKHKDVVKYLRKYSTLSHIRLTGTMLLGVEFIEDAAIARFVVTKKMLDRYGAREEDTEEALERALELPTVTTSILLVQRKDQSWKVSLRSEAIDVGSVAKSFGGGGHKSRAGCEFGADESVEEIHKKLLKKVKEIEKKEK